MSAPRGSTHRLTRARTARPVLAGTRPGRYVLRDTVSGPSGPVPAASALQPDGRRVELGHHPGHRHDGRSGDPVSAGTDAGGAPGITLGGTFIPAGISGPGVQVLVLDRATLAVQSPSSAAYPAGSMDQLQSYLEGLASAGAQPLVAVASLPGGPAANPGSDAAALALALTQIQGTPEPVNVASPFSVVGIPAGASDPPSLLAQIAAPLDGFFTPDVNGNFTFTFGDYVPFDTGPYSATAGNTITVGQVTYSVPPAASGTGGFQVVYMDPITLAGTCVYYATGGGPALSCTTGSVPSAAAGVGASAALPACGPGVNPPCAAPIPNNGGGPGPACGPGIGPCVNPNAGLPATAMNTALTAAAAAGQVVAVAAVGSPMPAGGGFAAAAGIAALGGTEDVFSQLGPGSTYAFVGPTPAQKFPAEASSVITPGASGEVTGVLTRASVGGAFAPLAADVSGQADFAGGLGAIAFQPSSPWPYSATTGQQAALADISARLGLGCDAQGACNVRYAYGTLKGAISGYSTELNNLTYPAGASFTAQDFANVKNELLAEFPRVGTVWSFIGELQQPYISGGAGELANLTNIAGAIQEAVSAPPSTATQSFLSFATDVMWAVSIIPGEGQIADVAEAAGVLAVAAAFGSDLSTLGSGAPQPNVVAAGDQLASDILDRADQMQQGIGNLGAIIVADPAKLTQVATLASGQWALTTTQENVLEDAIETGAAQTFYTGLMPLAYSAWQVTGASLTPAPAAANWSCVIGRNLAGTPFKGIPASGQIVLQSPAIPGLPAGTSQVYALYQEGKNPASGANEDSEDGQAPASLTNDLFAAANPDTQAAGLYPSWFWERAYLRQGAKVLPATGGFCAD